MKNSFNHSWRNASFLSFFLSFFLLAAISNPVQAACPTNIAPTIGQPGYTPWTGPWNRNFTISGTNCVASVKFCKREVNGVWQYYLDEITPLAGSWAAGCDQLLWIDIINDIRDQLMVESENYDIMNCATQVLTVVSIYTGQCISFDLMPGTNIPVCRLCPDSYCVKTCEVCDGPTGRVVQNCTFSTVGESDCELFSGGIENVTVGDIPLWEGEYNTCYLLACDQYDN